MEKSGSDDDNDQHNSGHNYGKDDESPETETYDSADDGSLLKFISPFTMLLIGMSNSGKSNYMRKLLEQPDKVFTEPPSRILYFYNIHQRLFDEMEQSVAKITFIQGLPSRSEIESWAVQEKHLMLVFDDLYHELINSKDITDLTIMLCHHMNISCIMTSHNIFMSSKYSKTITTNIHYILLFTLQNRLQLSTLGTQLFCHKNKSRNFVHVYDSVMQDNRFSPLIIDLSPQTENKQQMLRSNVLPGEFPIIYEII